LGTGCPMLGYWVPKAWVLGAQGLGIGCPMLGYWVPKAWALGAQGLGTGFPINPCETGSSFNAWDRQSQSFPIKVGRYRGWLRLRCRRFPRNIFGKQRHRKPNRNQPRPKPMFEHSCGWLRLGLIFYGILVVTPSPFVIAGVLKNIVRLACIDSASTPLSPPNPAPLQILPPPAHPYCGMARPAVGETLFVSIWTGGSLPTDGRRGQPATRGHGILVVTPSPFVIAGVLKSIVRLACIDSASTPLSPPNPAPLQILPPPAHPYCGMARPAVGETCQFGPGMAG
jgi:hypothetical protein